MSLLICYFLWFYEVNVRFDPRTLQPILKGNWENLKKYEIRIS